MDEQALRDLCERYRAVYSGAVADVLDKRGLRDQVVHGAIQGLTLDTRVAGPAFTCKGAPATALEPDDWEAFFDALTPLCVAVADVSQIVVMGIPAFARYRSPASPTRYGSVLVRPGDFIVGDADGIVIVPAQLAVEALEEVEPLATTETNMRQEFLEGCGFSEVYDRYQVG